MEDKKTSWIYKIIRYLVFLFSPHYRLVGTENLPEGACVIVGNHCQMFGPIMGELYVPGRHWVWCAGEMMHWKEVQPYAFRDFWSGKPRWIRWFFKIASYVITPLAVCVFNNAHTVPVYHDTRLITTFRRSVELLQQGCRVVIFPEHYDEHNNIVHDFQDKFVDVARFYYKKTGETLRFVPVYVAPKLAVATFGEPVTFDPNAPIAGERRRICDTLMDRITDIAVSLPEHTVVPYPNISKRDYPKNIPLEVTAKHEKTDD